MAGRSGRPPTSSMAGPVPDTEPLTVLLAEHEPEVAEMSARYLRRDGLRVRLVTTPELAVAELTSGPDAVAVLDLTMPGRPEFDRPDRGGGRTAGRADRH